MKATSLSRVFTLEEEEHLTRRNKQKIIGNNIITSWRASRAAKDTRKRDTFYGGWCALSQRYIASSDNVRTEWEQWWVLLRLPVREYTTCPLVDRRRKQAGRRESCKNTNDNGFIIRRLFLAWYRSTQPRETLAFSLSHSAHKKPTST